ncbi:DUF4825 domain-containing protein [Brevibacillus nitrificans]|uniref:DUF4825 domain-containing protein n=1 Tax=Brevibacillus nitrificans TaxID=651560 RepID=UPI00262F4998|nr:DUF4825 domain-containing protein [Brevibacillus nitrificans]
MAARNKVIVALAMVGVLLLVYIQGVLIPNKLERERRYEQEQQSPQTHDVNTILPYKSQYMGDASNLTNLFAHLPLNGVKRTFQLYPDDLTMEINYLEKVADVGEEQVNSALLYNSIAAFALIDNLQTIRYRFPDAIYQLSRGDVQQLLHVDLAAELLEQQTWKNEVQGRIEEWTKESSRFWQ